MHFKFFELTFCKSRSEIRKSDLVYLHAEYKSVIKTLIASPRRFGRDEQDKKKKLNSYAADAC